MHISSKVSLWIKSHRNGQYIIQFITFIISCFQYWGWCKYRYREVEKKTFQDAKDAAKQYLEACPAEVIRRFINRSWRFMSAYRLGLTGHAAAWAVKKQKQHRQVSQRAMMSISYGLRPTKTHRSHTKKLRKFSQKIWHTENIVGIWRKDCF